MFNHRRSESSVCPIYHGELEETKNIAAVKKDQLLRAELALPLAKQLNWRNDKNRKFHVISGYQYQYRRYSATPRQKNHICRRKRIN